MSLSIKKKAIKKAVSVVTMVATVVCMSGIASFSVTSLAIADVVDGALIKSNATNPDGTPTLASLDVYIVKLVGTKKFKRLVLNPTVFNSYGHLNWEDIQTVSVSVMGEYTTSALVRVDTDPDEKVYALAPENDTGKKSWVNVTSAEFLGVAGSEDGDSIYTINSTDAGSYVAVGDVTTVADLETFYSAGTLPEDVIITEGGLSVALSSTTPAAGSVLKGSEAVLYTEANFTANSGEVTVTGMKVKKSGLGSYADFDKVWLVVDGIRRGSVKTINSADEASLLFSTEAQKVVIPDGETKIFEIWASIGTVGTASNALSISEVTTSSDVNGLPVTGNAMTNSTATAPDVTIIHGTIGSTVDIGNTDAEVAKFKISNNESNETVVFDAITLKNISGTGTRIATDDLANFTLYDNSSNVIAGPIAMDSDNYLRFVLDTSFEIAAGTTKYEWFYVKADIMAGPTHYINLDIENASDVTTYGGTNFYHSDITISGYTAQEVQINDADLVITADTANNPVARDVLENTTIELLRANLVASKSAVTATALQVDITGADLDMAGTDEFENLRVYIDDVLVSEATGSSLSSTDDLAAWTINFTDEFSVDGTVPVRVEIDVKDLVSTTATNIKAVIAGSNITATRDSDGGAITESGTATGNLATVVVPGYKIYRSSTPVSDNKVLGSTDVEFLGLDLKSNNTSNVEVNKLKLELKCSGFTVDYNDVLNVELVDVNGNVLAGPSTLNSAEQVEFTSLGLDVDSNGTKVIVRADINSSMNDADSDFTAGTDTLYFIVVSSEGDANNTAYAGTDSGGNTIDGSTYLVNVSTETAITVENTGTLTVTAANDTPVSAQLVALSTDNTLAKWKFVSEYEDVQVKTVRVGFSTEDTSNVDPEDEVSRIGLYEGSVLLAETYSFSGGYTTFDITDDSFVVSSGSGNARYLTMKVDLNSTTNNVLDSGDSLGAVLIDITAWGTINEVAPVSGTTSDGFAFVAIAGTGKKINESPDPMTAADTTLTLDADHAVLVGDLVKVEDEQMYVSAVSTNDLTVVRGFNGTTAATHADNTAAYVARSLEGSNFKVYGNKLSITDASSVPSGTLAAWTTYTSVYKFKLTPVANATEDAVLNDIKVSLAQSAGIGVTVGDDWAITQMALYNGAGTKIAEYITGEAQTHADTINVSTDWVILDSLLVVKANDATGGADLSEAIASDGEEYTIKVITVGAVTTNDALQLTIANLGTVAADDGHLEWDDSTSTSTAIKWVDMGTVDSHLGGSFTK